jgi:hypothetical protein|tara:strand:+ start:126 stop:338 length:213 start_codon:yes stop_codon:yes gene_type:complete
MSRQIQSRAAQRVNLSLDSRVPLLEGDVDVLEVEVGTVEKKLDRIIYLLVGILITMISSMGTLWAGGLTV